MLKNIYNNYGFWQIYFLAFQIIYFIIAKLGCF